MAGAASDAAEVRCGFLQVRGAFVESRTRLSRPGDHDSGVWFAGRAAGGPTAAGSRLGGTHSYHRLLVAENRPARSASRVFTVPLAGLVVVTVAATGAGFLGGVWWGFDLAAHFRAHYAAVLAIGVVLLAFLRLRWLAVTGTVALAVNLLLIVPLYLTHPRPAMPGGATLRVLSFNVTASNPDRRTILEYLETGGADLIFLHESSTDWEDEITRAGLPYRMVSARLPGSAFGTAALIKGDASARVVALGEAGQQSIEVSVLLGGEPIKVLATHPLSPTSAARNAARDEQLRQVGEWAAAQQVPVVVIGDFNASTWSHGFALVERPAGLVNSQRGFGIQPSWPVPYGPLGIPIDHMMHSRELTTVDRRLGPSFGSDHASLWVTVEPAGP